LHATRAPEPLTAVLRYRVELGPELGVEVDFAKVDVAAEVLVGFVVFARDLSQNILELFLAELVLSRVPPWRRRNIVFTDSSMHSWDEDTLSE